eukprot:3682756-Amphidinium_carterae.1
MVSTIGNVLRMYIEPSFSCSRSRAVKGGVGSRMPQSSSRDLNGFGPPSPAKRRSHQEVKLIVQDTLQQALPKEIM